MKIYSRTGREESRPVIIVFAKAPVAGAVKTRLIPRTGAELAFRLHQAFVQDTLDSLEGFDVELHTDRPTTEWISQKRIKIQRQGDLGQRMFYALEAALGAKRSQAMILGSDSPTLPSRFLSQIFASPADVCLGPAEDGGYYAIACRKIKPMMFEGVSWSTSETRAQTIAAVQKSGLTLALGPEWYDVDCGVDLDRLIRDPGLRPATRHALTAAGLLPANPVFDPQTE